MKVTFPQMGSLRYPIRALLADLGVDVILPPPTSRRTVKLGARHAPEFACYPLKLSIGNYLEARELGADTILMAGGVGPCRFGYYAQVQRDILADLGCPFRMVVIEPPRGHLREMIQGLREVTGRKSLGRILAAGRLAWEKFLAIDALEAAALDVRWQEENRGDTDRVLDQGYRMIDVAADIVGTRLAGRVALEAMDSVPRRPAVEAPVEVVLLGEVFMVLEPFANLDIERRLGELGVRVRRSIYLSGWIRANLVLDVLRLKGGKAQVAAARPYLNHFVGGHGVETVGDTVLSARAGCDGVIQVAPLTCMPEIVAQGVLPAVSRDWGVPVMTVYLDEHAGEAGLQTRLEAFVDMLRRRKVMTGGKERAGIHRH